MKILVINAGSSSLKYQLIDMEGEQVLGKGICERIGQPMGSFTHKAHGQAWKSEVAMPDHTAAFAQVKKALTEGEGKVIHDLSEVSAIGHRVVQGGSKYDHSVVITDEVLADIDSLKALAPLHNPAALQGIAAATATFGKTITQVAVFDTAFHQTMEQKVFMFGLPYEYYEKYGVRRYGFHGTSHRYVSARCCELLGRTEGTRIITCHLGSGSSIAAIKDGKVVKSITKEPVREIRLEAEADHTILTEQHSYDVALVRIRAVDDHGNVLPFYQEPVRLIAEGDISIIGPDTIALQGGMGGTYVKSLGRSGQGTLLLQSRTAGEVRIPFQIKI